MLDPMFSNLFEEKRRRKSGSGGGRPRLQLTSSGKSSYGHGRKSSKAGGKKSSFGLAPKARSIVKSRYIKNNHDAGRHIAQHMRYIQNRQRDEQKEPESRFFYDRDSQGIERAEAVERIMGSRGDKIAAHKIILSPGDESVDVVAYTRETMQSLEERLGVKLEYVFVIHKNTSHQHSHVMVAGQALEPLEPERNINLLRVLDGANIRLDRSDLDYMRDIGNAHLLRQRGIDHLYDLEVQLEFDKPLTLDDRERLFNEASYNKNLSADLHLVNTDIDRKILQELGLESDNYSQAVNRGRDAYDELNAGARPYKGGPLELEHANLHVSEQCCFESRASQAGYQQTIDRAIKEAFPSHSTSSSDRSQETLEHLQRHSLLGERETGCLPSENTATIASNAAESASNKQLYDSDQRFYFHLQTAIDNTFRGSSHVDSMDRFQISTPDRRSHFQNDDHHNRHQNRHAKRDDDLGDRT